MDEHVLHQRIATLLRGDVGQPATGFVDELRRDLAAEVEGRPRAIAVGPIEARRARRRALPWLAGGLVATAAAATVVVVVRDDTSNRVVPTDPTEVSTPVDEATRFLVGVDTPAIVPTVTELAALDDMPFPTPVFQRDGSLLVIDESTDLLRLVHPDGTIVVDTALPEALSRAGGAVEPPLLGPDDVMYVARGDLGLEAWAPDGAQGIRFVQRWDTSEVCAGSCSGLSLDPVGSRIVPHAQVGSAPGVAFVDPSTGAPSGAKAPAAPTLVVAQRFDATGAVETVEIAGTRYEVVLVGLGSDDPTSDADWTPQPDGTALRTVAFTQPGRPTRFRLVRLHADGGVRVYDLGAADTGTLTAGFGTTPDGTLLGLLMRDGVTHLVRLD